MTKVMIIGSGNVGQANGRGLIAKGHDVVFIDIDSTVVDSLRRENFNALLVNDMYTKNISNSDDETEADISILCVPTPFIEYKKNNNTTTTSQSTNFRSHTTGQIDLSNIINAVCSHARWLKSVQKRKSFPKKGITINDHNYPYRHLMVIRSTVPPLATRSTLLPLIESNAEMKVGSEIGLCMQPEFLRTSSGERDYLNPRATIIGEFDKISGDILEDFYGDFGGQIFRTDLETAEFMKYIQNSFNATKISFANEMWLLGRQLGLDANFALQMTSIVGEGFWNPRYGTIGGRAYDGVCLPKDVKGFLNFAREKGFDMPLLSAVDIINSYMNKGNQRKKIDRAKKSEGEVKRGKLAGSNKLVVEHDKRIL